MLVLQTLRYMLGMEKKAVGLYNHHHSTTAPSSTRPIIQVRLREHGSELIEVSDNGSGIDASDWEAVGLKYHTSKLSAFEDLQV